MCNSFNQMKRVFHFIYKLCYSDDTLITDDFTKFGRLFRTITFSVLWQPFEQYQSNKVYGYSNVKYFTLFINNAQMRK